MSIMNLNAKEADLMIFAFKVFVSDYFFMIILDLHPPSVAFRLDYNINQNFR